MKKKVILESNKETVTDKEITDVANLVATIQETQNTLELILTQINQNPIVYKDEALNERDNGDLIGQNKAEAAE